MATDFNKVLYHQIEEHIKRQAGEQKFNKVQWRKIMDEVMERFCASLIAIVASVEMSQREAKQKDAEQAAALESMGVEAAVESTPAGADAAKAAAE